MSGRRLVRGGLTGGAGVAIVLLLLGSWVIGHGSGVADSPIPPAPPSTIEPDSAGNAQQPRTPIAHLVVLMQENHTFDNYFGTYPGADGIPPGTCLPTTVDTPDGSSCVAPFHVATTGAFDLAHNGATFQGQYNNGEMNGFVRTLNDRNQSGGAAMGYYDDRDLPYYWNLAADNVLFDRFFSSVSGGSFLNHLFWVAGASGGNNDGIPRVAIGDVPTIFDELEARRISWKFYVQDYDASLTYRTARQYGANRASQVVRVPLLAIDRFIDDPRLASHIVDLDQYFDDLEHGTLPAVAYMVPSGTSEHPPGSLQSGQRFVISLVHALMRSSAWPSAAFMWTYASWGGWYDHVPPPQVDAYGYGFRVPAVLVSAYARRGQVDHSVLDFASILTFIEDNWDLKPLGERDALAANITGAFDFAAGPRAPRFVSPARGQDPASPPVRDLIYAAYGGATVAVGLFVAGVAAGRRRWQVPAGRAPRHILRPGVGRIPRAWLAASVLVVVALPVGVLVAIRTATFTETPANGAVAPDLAPLESDESSFPARPLGLPPPATGGPAQAPGLSASSGVLSLAPHTTAVRDLRTIVDQRFARRPVGWPDDATSTAWFDARGYHLLAREPSGFVAIGAPHAGQLWDVSVQATLHRVGGPAGGGYGLVVRAAAPGPLDGVDQGGRYYVAQIGDVGEVSIQRRELDRWVDLVPWTPSPAVRRGAATNQLELRAIGSHLSFLVNGDMVANLDDAALPSGRVGVFASGALNEVVLDRFVVRAPTR